MPPKPRHPEAEGGPEPSEFSRRSVAEVAQTHGMTEEQAAELLAMPLTLVTELVEETRPLDDVVQDAHLIIAAYEEAYGPHADWDELRYTMGYALVGMGKPTQGVDFLGKVMDIRKMALRLAEFLKDGVREQAFMPEEINIVYFLLQREFERNGRGEEFAELGTPLFGGHPKTNQEAEAARAISTEWAWQEEIKFPLAMWQSIMALLEKDDIWQEMTLEQRRQVAVHFAGHQQDMHSSKARKTVENFKECMQLQEAQLPGPLWDHFRMTAALGLYIVGLPNFGRGVARSITDETMAGRLCFALVESGREREAFEVAEEIPSADVFAQVVYQAEWSDRTRIEALLTDMTVVTPNSRRKYDPARRLGVAEGLLALFDVNLHEAEESGDEALAAHWREQARIMDGRVKLLQRQIEMRYITAPAAKKK